MPVIDNSEYSAPYYLFSRHLETILPALFRKVGNIFYTRERIFTPDNDFLDLDWSERGSDTLVVVSHGLEGDTQTGYMKGMIRTLNMEGWDALAWNYRGCSGEMNRLCRFYHSGETKDLDFVLHHAISKNRYRNILLVGFSIGGNITLKYLGEKKEAIHPLVRAAVTFSVPCHLESAARHLTKSFNKVYLRRFLRSLEEKIRAKASVLPGSLSTEGIEKISDFLEFDNRYTAPMNGFRDAHEYWEHSSSLFYLPAIRIPTLLVNAQNDPFLSPECYPVKEAEENPFLFLEMPEKGGHVGFYSRNREGRYWSEARTVEFIRSYL